MGRKANRVLLLAMAVSLTIHFFLLGSAGNWWQPSAVEVAFPIEASLMPPVVATPAAEAPRQARRAPAPPQESSVATPATAPEPDTAALVASAPAASVPEPPSPPPNEPAVAPPAAPTAQPALSRPVVRTLPANIVMHYSVQMGEGDGGFVAGRATYIWHAQKNRYSLVSTVEATGLTALFISGRIVQVSEGDVSPAGLRPTQYWLQRNERKQDVARFNWDVNQLTLAGRGGVALTPQAQDLLSFSFHLAMTVREGEAPFALGITNGRKLNEYGFSILGRERLEMSGNQIDTLHLQGAREGEGALDVWLDLARSGLPARIRTLDRKGKVMELRLEDVAVGDGGSGG